MPQVESGRGWPRWLPSFGLVVTLHALVWWGLTHYKDEILPSRPLPVMQIMQVTLVTPSLPIEPRLALPPKLERQPRPLLVQSAVSVPAPMLPHAMQSAPAEAVPAFPAAPVQPAAEPPLESPSYKAAYLNNPPKPDYPSLARRRAIEGTVLVRAEVGAGGECLDADLKKSSGAGILDRAALEAVKKWRFVPARRGNQAVIAWVEVPITFKLENN